MHRPRSRRRRRRGRYRLIQLLLQSPAVSNSIYVTSSHMQALTDDSSSRFPLIHSSIHSSIHLISLCLQPTQLYWPPHTHTHPFNGPLSGTTRASRYQKGKTNPDFTEARDSEWQWHQLDHMQVCISLQSENHVSTLPLSFLQAGCPFCHPTNSIKALTTNARQCCTYFSTL